MSLIRLVREALPRMRERGGGRIVNVASSSIKQPLETLILSNTFRAGVAGLVKSLVFELAPDGILVNTLVPGASTPNARPLLMRHGRRLCASRSRQSVDRWRRRYRSGATGGQKSLPGLRCCLPRSVQVRRGILHGGWTLRFGSLG